MFVNIYFKPSCINRFQMQQKHATRCCLVLAPPVPARRLLLEQCPVSPESGSVLRAAPLRQSHFSSSSSPLPPLLHLPQTCGHLSRAGHLRPASARGPGRAGVRTASRGAGMETESFLGVSKAVAKEREGGRDAAPRRVRQRQAGAAGARSPGSHQGLAAPSSPRLPGDCSSQGFLQLP